MAEIRKHHDTPRRWDTRFHDVDWNDVVPRAVLYARRLYQKYPWLGQLKGNAPGGFEPRDFVQLAILKILSGDACWPRDHDFLTVLFQVIRREYHHLYKKSENHSTARAHMGSYDSAQVIGISSLPDRSVTIESAAIEQQERSLFLNSIKNDYTLFRLSTLIFDGYQKSDEIAKVMEISVTDVYNLNKRLRRAIESYRRNRV